MVNRRPVPRIGITRWKKKRSSVSLVFISSHLMYHSQILILSFYFTLSTIVSDFLPIFNRTRWSLRHLAFSSLLFVFHPIAAPINVILPFQQLTSESFTPSTSTPSLPSDPLIPTKTSLGALAVMIISSMRSQDSSPNRQSNDAYKHSLPPQQKDSPPHILELRRQVAGAMLSVIPLPLPTTPKRPKLSLQTSAVPRSAAVINLPASTESPTIRSTHANVFDATPPTPTSTTQPQVHFPSTASAASPGVSPFHNDAPYILPIGTHSILRNSPLPRRHLSATSIRAPRRIFPPTKRVAFQERPVEILPTPVIEGSSDTEVKTSSEDDQTRRREVIEAEEGHAIPIYVRRKRRDWVWRPMEDDVRTSRDLVYGGIVPETAPIQMQGGVLNAQSDSGSEEDDVAIRQFPTANKVFN